MASIFGPPIKPAKPRAAPTLSQTQSTVGPTRSVGPPRPTRQPPPIKPAKPVQQPAQAPQSATVGPNLDIASSLSSLLSSMPQSQQATASTGPNLANVASEDPYLKDYLAMVKARLDNPEGSTKRAIDVTGSAIRDLGEGEKSALHAGAARRGVLSGSTIPQIGEAAISGRVQQSVGKAAADIALGRERDNDAFLQGAGGAFGSIGAAQRADRSLALQQWQAGEAAKRAAEQANLQQWMSRLDLIGNLLRL